MILPPAHGKNTKPEARRTAARALPLRQQQPSIASGMAQLILGLRRLPIGGRTDPESSFIARDELAKHATSLKDRLERDHPGV